MNEADLNQYLGMLDKKARVYRAGKSLGQPDAEKNLRRIDRMAVKAINQYFNEQ